MQLHSDRLTVLQECGLSESQARVFLALVDHPFRTASNLARSSQLPRNRLYEVLEELAQMRLVDIVLEEPRRYRARSMDAFITRCTGELRAKVDELEARREYLKAAFQPSDPGVADDHERGTTQAVLGRRAVAEEIERMLAGARREIVLAGSSGGSLRLAKHLLEAGPLAPDVGIELYAPRSSADGGGWERFFEAKVCPVTWLEAPRATLTVVADQEMLRIQAVPDDAKTHVGQDFALLTNNLAMIHDELLGIRSLPRASR